MFTFYYRTIFVYLIIHLYLFYHARLFFNKKSFTFLLFPFFLLMGVFPITFMIAPEGSLLQNILALIGQIWLPVAFFSLPMCILYDCYRLARPVARILLPSHTVTGPYTTGTASIFILVCAALYSYGLIEARSLTVTRLELSTEKLPADTERLRLAFAADLHISPHTGFNMLHQTVELILKENPDCILLGGDILDDALQGTRKDILELKRLTAPLGVYAVLGNHEAFGDVAFAVDTFRQAGITLLSNRRVQTGPLTIVGIDDPDVTRQKNAPAPDVVSLLVEPATKGFVLLLAHRPTVAPGSIALFDLQLSGHSHGGQIPPLKPYIKAQYGSVSGLSRHVGNGGESLLFITTGTGFSKVPIRLDTPPEIVIIDLVRASKASSGASSPELP